MNDGAHTRDNTRARRDIPGPQGSSSGGKSAPDVSICGSTWSSKFSWKTIESIGSSDHLPILITINERTEQQPIYNGQVRWRTTNVDWNAYTEEIEASIEPLMSAGATIDKWSHDLNTCITNAASKHLGTVRPGKGRKTWETPQVREAIRRRNKLRKNVASSRDEWITSCKAAREAVNEAKINAWRKVLDDASNSQNPASP